MSRAKRIDVKREDVKREATPSAGARAGVGARFTSSRLHVSCAPRVSRRPRARRARVGVGLVELLIALAIAASLLTAVAVATDAAFHGYAVNQEQSSLTQAARVGLHRMLLQIRTGDAHAADPNPASPANLMLRDGLTVYGADPVTKQTLNSSIALLDETGNLYHYYWDKPDGRVVVSVRQPGAAAAIEHTLMRGVTDFRVTLEPLPGTRGKLRRATVQFTLQATGANDEAGDGGARASMTFSSSAVPRRNVW
jgi:hypothetical protein